MSFELVKKYSEKVDEQFAAESKLSLLTNSDYDWSGAHSVVVWSVSTVPMGDYSRHRGDDYEGSEASLSRFGKIVDLDAQTQEMLLTRDRSFIFNIDLLDQDETAQALQEATALSRQIREQTIPEIDAYAYAKMVKGAGTTATAAALTAENVYDAITEGTETMDDAEVPDNERCIVVTPAVHRLLKKSPDINLDCDISAEQRLRGVVGMVDGLAVIKVPASRLPENFGFLICHPSATCAPVKLEDYGTHKNTCLSSGTIVTGRVCYDCFVLKNKAKGLYYHPIA